MLIYGSIAPQLVQTEARSSLIREAATLKSESADGTWTCEWCARAGNAWVRVRPCTPPHPPPPCL